MSTWPNNRTSRGQERSGEDTEERNSEELRFSEKPPRPESHPEAREMARAIMRKYRKAYAELAK